MREIIPGIRSFSFQFHVFIFIKVISCSFELLFDLFVFRLVNYHKWRIIFVIFHFQRMVYIYTEQALTQLSK